MRTGTDAAVRWTAAVLVGWLAASVAPAFAQAPVAPAPPHASSPLTQTPLRSAPVVQTPLPEPSTIEEAADSLFTSSRDMFRSIWSGAFNLVSPPSALDVARRARPSDPYDFVAMMDAAGYKLKEVESSVALIPSVGFAFAIARELSDADREWVAVQLERHARRRSGLFASAERTIIQSLLDAQELGGYQIERLDVDLFPWPRVKFRITPSDSPMSPEGSRILRAIERVGDSVKAGAPPAALSNGTPAPAPRTAVQQRPIAP
jgi:hypothetical protein